MGMNYVGNAIFKLITFQNSADLKFRTAKTGRNDKNRQNPDAKPDQDSSENDDDELSESLESSRRRLSPLLCRPGASLLPLSFEGLWR